MAEVKQVHSKLAPPNRAVTHLSAVPIALNQCEVSFKGPGYSADAFIDRATGKYELTENRMGLVAILNDLHKGRDSGKPWAVVIDISAILLTLVSLTGPHLTRNSEESRVR